MFGVFLRRARKAAGLSLRDMGKRVGLSHTAIKKYEDGHIMPSSDVVEVLSEALRVQPEYFFRPQVISLDGIEYRKQSSLPKKRLSAITHKVIDRVERRLELESLFPWAPVKEFEMVGGLDDSISSGEQIERAAERVRMAWELGAGPIPDLIRALEANGLRVFMIDAGAREKFDGLSARTGGIPILVADSGWPGERQRFTLAHELGHIILADRLPEGSDVEQACNRFAGAFLFPRKAVLRELGEHRNSIEVKELMLLKREFGLSMSGILHRAHDLGVLPDLRYRDQVKRFREEGWRRREPGSEYPAEKVNTFERLVFRALGEQFIGESRAAELMGMPVEDFGRYRSAREG